MLSETGSDESLLVELSKLVEHIWKFSHGGGDIQVEILRVNQSYLFGEVIAEQPMMMKGASHGQNS